MTPRSWGHGGSRSQTVDRQMTGKSRIGGDECRNGMDGAAEQEERPGQTRGLHEEIIMTAMMDACHALHDGSLKEGAHRRWPMDGHDEEVHTGRRGRNGCRIRGNGPL
jgi:hypothetical protein